MRVFSSEGNDLIKIALSLKSLSVSLDQCKYWQYFGFFTTRMHDQSKVWGFKSLLNQVNAIFFSDIGHLTLYPDTWHSIRTVLWNLLECFISFLLILFCTRICMIRPLNLQWINFKVYKMTPNSQGLLGLWVFEFESDTMLSDKPLMTGPHSKFFISCTSDEVMCYLHLSAQADLTWGTGISIV